jgi:outer membrane protein
MKQLCLLSTLVVLVHPHPACATDRALSLADAIALARKNSPALRQNELEIERAKLQVLKRRLAWFDLKILGTASSTYRASDPDPGYCAGAPNLCAQGLHRADLSFDLKVPFWTGFTLEANLASAQQRERSSVTARRRGLRDLTADVTRAYWEVRRRELALEALDRLTPGFHELEELTRERVRSGVAPVVDSNRARAAMLSVSTQRVSVERDLEQARAELGSLLQLEEPVLLTDDPMRYRAQLPPLDEVLHEASKGRHELTEARGAVSIAEQELRAARGAYWPQLSLVVRERLSLVGEPYDPSTGDAPTASTATPTYFVVPTQNFYAGVQMSWNLFEMMGTWLRVRDATLARDRSLAQKEQRRYQIAAEVRTAHAELDQALRLKAPTSLAAALAREDIDLLRKRYSTGAVQLFDVLTAQDELLQSELDLVNRSVDVVEADARMAKARGRSERPAP